MEQLNASPIPLMNTKEIPGCDISSCVSHQQSEANTSENGDTGAVS